ncbi:MAG: hypothetical protein QOH13_1398 [Thermoleophilaceae bacterium]|nr:hypothetical protein [Thermoleophilaceae bacterium]
MAAVYVKAYRQLLMTLPLARSDGLIETGAAAAPPPSRPSRLPRWQIESLLVGLLYGAHDATRGLRHRRDPRITGLYVELRGFEPLTPSMRTRCATGLRHSPVKRDDPLSGPT